MGREFRVFLYRQAVVGCGCYWDAPSPLTKLTVTEERSVIALAQEAARRLDVPFMAVDVAQTEAGEWIVIEIGDGQFCGVTQMSPVVFWRNLKRIIESQSPVAGAGGQT